MVGKMPNVTWLDGSFEETMKGWQSGWFYITEPCNVRLKFNVRLKCELFLHRSSHAM